MSMSVLDGSKLGAGILIVQLLIPQSALAESKSPEAENQTVIQQNNADQKTDKDKNQTDKPADEGKTKKKKVEKKKSQSPLDILKPSGEKKPRSEQSLWERYTSFWWSELDRLEQMDLYGVTSQLPKGYFKVKYEYSYINAASRWTNDYKKTQLIPPVFFSDSAGNPIVGLDLGGSGYGEGHYFQFSYGITDALDFYFELPMQTVHTKLRPKVVALDPGLEMILRSLRRPGCSGSRCWLFGNSQAQVNSLDQTELFMRFMEMVLGRPRPGSDYNGYMQLADINTGFSWNYFRTPYFSAALTGRVHFPSGQFADPDNTITFATGPELDRGTGSYGVSATFGFDVRLPRFWKYLDIVFSSETTVGYLFESKHEYPSVFGGRGTPKYRDSLDELGTKGFSKPLYDSQDFLDSNPLFKSMAGDLNLGLYFPDLSGIKGKTYKYVPGTNVNFTLQMGVTLFGVGLKFGYGHLYNQEPVLIGDPNFVSMVKNLEILGDMEADELQVGISIPLYLLYIPVEIAYGYQWNIGGRNLIVFDNHHIITINGYLVDLFRAFGDD
ncbi:MAG: hypothetical protein GXP49_14955 [Deltaproteobacteria bacterium]|nr:hypothetical protein [Deltaproteobacteria bacterium]